MGGKRNSLHNSQHSRLQNISVLRPEASASRFSRQQAQEGIRNSSGVRSRKIFFFLYKSIRRRRRENANIEEVCCMYTHFLANSILNTHQLTSCTYYITSFPLPPCVVCFVGVGVGVEWMEQS